MSRHACAARVLEILAFALLLVGVVALAGQASTTAQILAALCVLPPALQHSTFDVVRDGAGLSWRIHDIRQSAVVVSMVTMVATSILACLRLWAQTRGRPIS